MESRQADEEVFFDSQTLPVEFREHQENFRFEGIRLGGDFALMAVPWRDNGDNGLIWIPVVKGEKSLFEDLSKVGTQLGEKFWKEKEIGGVEKERIVFALNNLKLPMLLAVHMAMNRPDLWEKGEIKVGNGVKMPESNVDVPVVIGIMGAARVGKSLLAAGLTIESDTELLSLTPSEMGAETYSNRFVGEMTGANMVSEVADVRSGRERKTEKRIIKRKMSVKQRLDEILNKVLLSSERPSVYVVDPRGFGFRSEVLPNDVFLPMDSYHMVAAQATEAMIYINTIDAGDMDNLVHVGEKLDAGGRPELMLLFGFLYLMDNLLEDNSLRITGKALDEMMMLVNKHKKKMVMRGRDVQKEFLASFKEE